MKGLTLSRRFFEEEGRPMVEREFPGLISRLAAGLVGEGSECFGYDDQVSQDHDFGPDFCLWLTEEDERAWGFRLMRACRRLPSVFLGIGRRETSLYGDGRRGVFEIGEFYRHFTGCPGVPQDPLHWLSLPEHALACAVNGQVFWDPAGKFTKIREELKRGYPEDVRLKKIAARAALMAQSGQYNYRRCILHGEEGAARLAAGEFVREAASLAFLLNNRYAPYYKWVFRSMEELPLLSGLSSELQQLLAEPLEKGIESVCSQVVRELQRQGLSRGNWEYLEPHALEVAGQIRDVRLRGLHLMEG